MNRKTTLILVSVFILLGLYAWWLQASPKPLEPTPTPPASTKFWDLAADQITGLQITDNATGQTVAVSKNALGIWNVVKPETKAADPQKISSLTSGLVNLTVMANITSTTDLATFGLVKPAFALRADLANGAALTAAIGDKIPTGNGYYVLRGGDANPVAVADYGLRPYLDLLQAPPYFVPTPTPVPTSAGAPALPTATAP